VKRNLRYGPAAQRGLQRLDRSEAERIVCAVESFSTTGRGDIKARKGRLKGRYRLRVGKWRVFFTLDPAGRVVVCDIDNRGQAC